MIQKGILAINSDTLRDVLGVEQCIDLIEDCMRQVSRGNVELPLRWGLTVPGRGVLGMMPGYLGEPACFGIKLVSLFPTNVAAGLSSHAGVILLYESEFGQPVALMEAGYVTAVRTAAASAVATRALARSDSETLAILGTGEQARFHLPAMLAIGKFSRVRIWGRSSDHTTAFINEVAGESDAVVEAAECAEFAVRGADVVCTVTHASAPILKGEWLAPGCHVNAVGASAADAREIDATAVQRSRFFVDFRPSAMNQAGDLLTAMEEGHITAEHIVGEIGEVLDGDAPGRLSDDDVSVYKSLGVAAQDLAVAWHVFRTARDQNLGTVIHL